MNNTATSLWEHQPQAHISLWKALDLFAAAYRARNMSPRTIAGYKERLTPFFRHLAAQLGREPALADITIPAFRIFIPSASDTMNR